MEVIIGYGEIGRGLFSVLDKSSVGLIAFDKDADMAIWPESKKVNYLHICFGWSDEFIPTVVKYVDKFKPEIVIIHSTVPIGTTRLIDEAISDETVAVHSPIRGQHPDLSGGIRTFVKMISGIEWWAVEQVAGRFQLAGISTQTLPKGPEVTEIAKLGCTFRYGLNIAAAQMMERLCKKYDVDFNDAYNAWEETYNEGYVQLGKINVIRPILFPGVIGGHCVMPNLELLQSTDDDRLILAIMDSNQMKKESS